MDKLHLQKLAERLNLTPHDAEPEPYILTPEEEERIIANEITSLKKYAAWRMFDKTVSEQEIQMRLCEIDWNAKIDRHEILNRANSNKNYEIWQKSQREREKQQAIEQAEALRKQCTAKYMYNLMAWTSKNVYSKDLIVNDDTMPLIKALCFFLSRDPRFETELGYCLNKGLLIRGISGLGKTHLVKCLADNPLNPIHVLSMIEVTDHIKADGEYTVDPGARKVLYLDDVGTEEATVNHYGTKITFFKNFIEMYYLKNRHAANLIISTNNSFAEIEEKYGFRVRSRVKDMFNIVDVKGKDLRGLL
jgi:DNA replication protein DnaC